MGESFNNVLPHGKVIEDPMGGVILSSFNAPGEVARAMVDLSQKKCGSSLLNLLVLGTAAGAYIGFGAQLAMTATVDTASFLGTGVSKLLFGAVFSVGLMIVVIAGAELFTGNNLIAVGVLAGRVPFRGLLRNWTVVYCANFLGSLLLVLLIHWTGLWKMGDGSLGAKAVSIARAKVGLTWTEAFFRAVLCNWLVCLAVWLAVAAKDVAGKIAGIFFPIMAFVASGFEHSIANMYFVPLGIAVKGEETVRAALVRAGDIPAGAVAEQLAGLTTGAFLVNNLIPVTLGNIVGGVLFVAAAYWLVYLGVRDQRPGGEENVPA